MSNLCSRIHKHISRAKCYLNRAYSKNSFQAERHINAFVGGSNIREFHSKASWTRSFSSALKLNEDNILSSTAEIYPLTGNLLHEFVWQNVDRWPDKTAAVCAVTGRSYTYEQLRKFSGRLATALRKNKLRPGDTIAIVLPNTPEFLIALLGASEAGLKATLVNGAYTAFEMNRQLENADASAVITVPTFYPVVEKSKEHNSNMKLPTIVVDDGSGTIPDGSIKFSELIADDIEEFSKFGKTERVKDDTVFMPYSSGTTGVPKGVELSHKNIIASCRFMLNPTFFPGYESTKTHQDVVPAILPMFHIFGLTVILIYLSVGAKLVCLPRFSPEGFLHCLKDFRSTILYAVPPFLLFLGNHESVTKHHLESIRYIMSGAAPISYEVAHRVLNRAEREIFMCQGYGITEGSGITGSPTLGPNRVTSVGVVGPNTEVRIVGHDGKDRGRNLGMGLIGELYARGPQVMNGYYKNPEATAKTMEDDWLKTGDLAYFDEEGFVYITGRLKEIIKVKGFQVSPNELEDVLLSYDKILDAAVVGAAHERYGEIPHAFVVPRPGSEVHEDEVKAFVADKVSKYKQLGSVTIVDAIPKSAAGKILKQQLKALLE